MIVKLLKLCCKKIIAEKELFRLKLGLLLLLVFFTYFAQGFTYYSTHNVANEVEVAGLDQNGVYVFSPNQGDTLLNPVFILTLPNGIVSTVNQFTTSKASNVSSTSPNVFEISFNTAINPGDTIQIEYSYDAESDAIADHQNGQVFRNEVSFSADSIIYTKNSNAYNILYAALTILSEAPQNQTVVTGDEYTVDLEIINGGYGSLSVFELSTSYSNVTNLLSSSVGLMTLLCLFQALILTQ